MAPDLKCATVYVMPLGGKGSEALLEAFDRNKKYLRGEVARRVNLRAAPDPALPHRFLLRGGRPRSTRCCARPRSPRDLGGPDHLAANENPPKDEPRN